MFLKLWFERAGDRAGYGKFTVSISGKTLNPKPQANNPAFQDLSVGLVDPEAKRAMGA